MGRGFRCDCPQCEAKYDLCPAARETETIITRLTRERDEALGMLGHFETSERVERQLGEQYKRERDEARAEAAELESRLFHAEDRGHARGVRDGEVHLARAQGVLREIEWILPPDVCPICYGAKQDGHAFDCRLAAALEGRDG